MEFKDWLSQKEIVSMRTANIAHSVKEFEGFLALSSGDRLQSFKTTKFPSFLKAGANPVHLLFESMLESCHEVFHFSGANLTVQALEVRTDVFDACAKRMNMQKS
uniref:Uncharacterized protein n=1 Tax=Micrurus corallinus TaxID=54390 RepID=A0A2D4FXU5_MICCO